MKKAVSALVCAISLLLGCGRVVYYRERQPDPDTLEAIKRSNMVLIEGSWDMSENDNRMHLEFYGETYSALIWQGETLIVSDRGTIEHYMPGALHLHSTLASCSDGRTDAIVTNFNLTSTNSLQLTQPSDKRTLTLARTSPMSPINPGICLWDSPEKADGLLVM